MKTSAIRKFRENLAAGRAVYGLWVTLESATITEMAAAIGLDWVVIDAEHGHLDWKEIVEHLRAAVRSDTVVLVRVAECNIGLIKRALDLGADGVVVPWVESAEQLREAVRFAHYPPEGVRGIGAERATCWGQCFVEHTAEANEHVMVVPIIETVRAGRSVTQLARVEGVEMFFFGPADYSSTAGYRGQWEGPGIAEAILAAKDALRSAGKYCGILPTSNENILQRRSQGFQMLGLGIDGGLLLRSIKGALWAVGRDRRINSNFTLDSEPAPSTPLDRPPESFRPDRPEVMTEVGQGVKTQLDTGVEFECQVGAHNHAHNLTTGIVTFAPLSQLSYHRHAFTESVTVLAGELTVEIEGRRYQLREMDNLVIPPGHAHLAKNASRTAPAVAHIAMPTSSPSRELVNKFFPRKMMDDESVGIPGGERVTRFQSAKRFEAGAGATFVDFFNEGLVPGIEMSGGHGLFRPGGRLPSHIHDFDESICIVAGTASCVVEGRKYSMSDRTTALQPRGRVHYFINQSQAPMQMIWVYAGPRPERLIVDEKNCTVEGNPWR